MSNTERGFILLFGGEKGGVGKSNLTLNTAAELAQQGADVIILDTDPQGTSSKWVDRRNEHINRGAKLPVVHCAQKDANVRQTALDLANRYEVVLIDTSGRDSRALRTALTVADTAYIPLRPSQADLETLPHLCELIEGAKDLNPKLKATVVLSLTPTNPFINEAFEAKSLIKDFGEFLDLCNVYIRDRKVYRDALVEGRGVVEMNNSKAKAEIQLLVQEVFSYAV